jgi:hypothetical protein
MIVLGPSRHFNAQDRASHTFPVWVGERGGKTIEAVRGKITGAGWRAIEG